MKNRRWLWMLIPAMGLAALFALGSSMQAQVGSEPKSTAKNRPAERAVAPADDQVVPAETKADTSRSSAARRAADDTRRPAALDHEGQEHRGGGWLGVYVAEPDEKKPAAGAQISQIFPASPAARAGFQPGDVITQVNDHKVTDPQAFVTAIESMPPGTKAAFSVQRNDQIVKLNATLGQNHWAFRGQNDELGRDFEGMRGRSSGEENYPFQALELEHNRRMAEQHQRIEQMIVELRDEVRQLREDLKAKK